MTRRSVVPRTVCSLRPQATVGGSAKPPNTQNWNAPPSTLLQHKQLACPPDRSSSSLWVLHD
ncbi:MAG: hypothetical protein ACK56F_11515, partial [bacterium]